MSELDDQEKAMRESLVSSIAVYMARVRNTESQKNDPDIRDEIGAKLDELVDSINIDITSWNHVKGRMLYDVYLAMRENEGVLTELDSTRSGLVIAQFSDKEQFYEHQTRVNTHRRIYGETKMCSICGQRKDVMKFKKKGGAVCNACRCKSYRERKMMSKGED